MDDFIQALLITTEDTEINISNWVLTQGAQSTSVQTEEALRVTRHTK